MTHSYLISILCVLFLSCQPGKQEIIVVEEEDFGAELPGIGKPTLSGYGFFTGALKDLQPAEGVVHYELNSPLFSDYAYKKRFISFPEGTKAQFSHDDVLDFPEGTVLIKNFYYPADFSQPEDDIRILETRLLILGNGEWKALPYIWNDEQTEAFLDVGGKSMDISWKHYNGEIKNIRYSVPNMNQCKGCHLRDDKVKPIGPTARQLNGSIEGHDVNQLAQLAMQGWLTGLPPLEQVVKLASYENLNEPLDARARAWLEVNCAHCHRPDGPAKTSGLHLLADTKNPYELGIGKVPVAAGRGSGGLNYDIVPGNPDASILYYRINSNDPGVMMPELGKTMIHEEGVALVREWIAKMN